MSQFTEYQVRRFQLLFNQYTQEARTEAYLSNVEGGLTSRNSLCIVDRMASTSMGGLSNEQSKDPFASESEEQVVKFYRRLTISELKTMMPRIGPSMTTEELTMLFYQYDTSCTGSLDFEDFLEFLADYQSSLTQRRERAAEYYFVQDEIATKHAINIHVWNEMRVWDTLPNRSSIPQPSVRAACEFTATYPTLDDYYVSMYLDDPEFFFTKTESVTTKIQETGIIEDLNILRRKMIVRIVSVRGLEMVSGLKIRKHRGIDFHGVDPMIRVTCAGITRETTALIDAKKMDWNQDLVFDITIPPGEVHDIQQWVERQNIEFSLWDLNNSGIIQNKEFMGYACVPLLKVFLSVRKPLSMDLGLISTDGATSYSELPKLGVSLTDLTQEKWAWAKVMDAYIHPEEVWSMKYNEQMQDNLTHDSTTRSSARDEQEYAGFKDLMYNQSIWEHYNEIYQSLRKPFRRRIFNTIALDETNNFRFLSALVHRLDFHSKDPELAARAVAAIPYESRRVPSSPVSQSYQSLLSIAETENLDRSEPPPWNSIAGWRTQLNAPAMACLNIHERINSPSTMIIRKRGNLMEHAVLLCGLLIGMGKNAFVALGKAKKRPYAYVVTIDPAPREDWVARNDSLRGTIRYKINENESVTFDRSKLHYRAAASEIRSANMDLDIRFYDPITGHIHTDVTAKDFGMQRIETLFNHENIYFNIQQSDLVARSFFCWDLTNSEYWFPFLSETSVQAPGSIPCFYSTPESLSSLLYQPLKTDAEQLSSLMEYIQLYRRHVLFIPTTNFHIEGCKYFQSYLDAFYSDHQDNMNQAKSLLINLDAAMSTTVPSRHYWKGWVLRFKELNVDLILEQLASLGYLDISIPNAMFVIALRSYPSTWFVTPTWVGIGYIADIIGMDLYRPRD